MAFTKDKRVGLAVATAGLTLALALAAGCAPQVKTADTLKSRVPMRPRCKSPGPPTATAQSATPKRAIPWARSPALPAARPIA